MSHFNPHSAIRNFRYSITYSNMIGKEYATHGYLGKDGIIIELIIILDKITAAD